MSSFDSATMRAANHKTEEDQYSTNSQLPVVCMLVATATKTKQNNNYPRHTGSFKIRSGDIFKKTLTLF